MPWFAKVYRDVAQLPRERAAVELAEYARHGAVPVPAVRRTVDGDLVEAGGRLRMSLWEYIPDVHTAEGAMTNDRWRPVGEAVGRPHRRLAEHPAARSELRAGSVVCDLRTNRARHERPIAAYGRKPALGGFEAWALEAARERQGLWGKLGRILDRLPELTFPVLHGALASPNLLLHGAQVAAIIDFQPPNPRYAAWEIARIACLLGWEAWLSGLSELLDAYQDARPAARRSVGRAPPGALRAGRSRRAWPRSPPRGQRADLR
ncbi:MAG: hypothetical protein H5T76_22425, partial [Streptomyces sp.]|nr:hypothetical protein [Streptomyces sp.]